MQDIIYPQELLKHMIEWNLEVVDQGVLTDIGVFSRTQPLRSSQVIVLQVRWVLDAWTDFWPKERKVDTQEMS